MEAIYGKRSTTVDAATLDARLSEHEKCVIDIGTGDGRFVHALARARPRAFVVGLDACRENLRAVSRAAPPNALFVIANALALPRELAGIADHVTINFPWGSLLRGLLDGEPTLLDGLLAIIKSSAALEVRLNGGALLEAGWSLEDGGICLQHVLGGSGFVVGALQSLDVVALRACPTTWAKRLAFGRDPRALYLCAHAPGERSRDEDLVFAPRVIGARNQSLTSSANRRPTSDGWSTAPQSPAARPRF